MLWSMIGFLVVIVIFAIIGIVGALLTFVAPSFNGTRTTLIVGLILIGVAVWGLVESFNRQTMFGFLQ